MKKRILIIFLIIFILFFVAFFYNFYITNEKDDVNFVPSKELELFYYSGEVIDFNQDYFILETFENTQGEFFSVKVKMNEKTEIVDANELKYIDVPKEYLQNLSFLEYISNLEESYTIFCVVESYSEFNKNVDEIYADKINWSISPAGELTDSKYEKVCEEFGIEVLE